VADLKLEEYRELGENRGKGNLLGIQTFMQVSDYLNADILFRKLSGYLAAARERSWLNEKTVAVFPEYIGTWLVAAGEQREVFTSKSLSSVMKKLVAAHPFEFVRYFLTSRVKGKVKAGIFCMKAAAMADQYTRVFSRLAVDFGVTVVAGTILLPEPSVTAGRVVVGKAGSPLQNVSAVFQPGGKAFPHLTRKCYPTQDELSFIKPAQLEDISFYETLAGRLGVLVCADSWFPQCYQWLQELGIDMLAVPSYLNHADIWDTPWAGYYGKEAADDLDPGDIGVITESQAWQKYALAGRLASCRANAGINVFLQGELWDIGSDGLSVMMKGDNMVATSTRMGALLNLWL
jgi:hypothetical protein